MNKHYKKGIYLVYNTRIGFPTLKNKLEHIWNIIFENPITVTTYINARDIEEFKRK